jgi:hypothetical protein
MYFIMGHLLVLILFGTIYGWSINIKNVFKDKKNIVFEAKWMQIN